MLVSALRWKALFYNKNDKSSDGIPETYGLKSTNYPAQVKELILFENDLTQLVKNIKFRNVRSDFQQKLSNDVRSIVILLRELNLDTELVIKQCSMHMNIIEYHSKSLRIVLKQDCLVS